MLEASGVGEILEQQIAAERKRISTEQKEIIEERKTLEMESIGLVKNAGEISIGLITDETGMLAGLTEKKELNIRQLERQLAGQLELQKVENDIAQAKKDNDAEALKLSEAKKQSLLDNTTALNEYNARQFDSLSATKQQLALVQTEIDRVVELKNNAKELGEEWSGFEVLLIDLLAEKNELLEESNEIIITNDESMSMMTAGAIEGLLTTNDLLLEQDNTVNQLTIDYEALAKDGLGAFATNFKAVGEGSITVLKAMKQAGKDAVSAMLEALAQEAIVRAALNFATLTPKGIASGVLFTAAAAGAYAASGAVQNLAEGGVLQPSAGGTPAIMAEAGVPEMAMPLTSAAINPFADAVASRMGNTTNNNNTQNFNSMFSLADDNKTREAARRLFPALEMEAQRRGFSFTG